MNDAWSSEDLMAYADGQLQSPQRDALERALAGDAALRARVAQLRRQRERVAAAFALVLEEPVPDRLSALLERDAAAAPVVSLASARAERAARRGARLHWGWAQWGGMAASVALGVLIGLQIDRADSSLALRDGRVVAGGVLERALSQQLASDGSSASAVALQLSFVDRTGRYCRTFSTAALAGLACRDGGHWAVQQAVAAEPGGGGGALRQAATPLPRTVLDAVDQRIAGPALDAAAERRARDAGWRAP